MSSFLSFQHTGDDGEPTDDDDRGGDSQSSDDVTPRLLRHLFPRQADDSRNLRIASSHAAFSPCEVELLYALLDHSPCIFQRVIGQCDGAEKGGYVVGPLSTAGGIIFPS